MSATRGRKNELAGTFPYLSPEFLLVRYLFWYTSKECNRNRDRQVSRITPDMLSSSLTIHAIASALVILLKNNCYMVQTIINPLRCNFVKKLKSLHTLPGKLGKICLYSD